MLGSEKPPRAEGIIVRFYTGQHAHYCGIDLHARSMYLCVLDSDGAVLLHKNLPATAAALLAALAAFRKDLVVATECLYTWYWVADVCAREKIPFVLGHALYMKAIHGAKAKNDRIDAHKIAALLRGNLMPMAYVYPSAMRATRDLLRRRMYISRHRAELIRHVGQTNSQHNLPDLEKKLAYKGNREGVPDRFLDASARKNVEVDLTLMGHYDEILAELELYIVRTAKGHDPQAYSLLKTVPGIGKILALVILYEVHDIARFETVQDFASYCRLVRPARESAGKQKGHGPSKMGNAHLKWAFSEGAVLFLRQNPEGQKHLARLERKHGKPRALTILAHKLGRAVYHMLKRKVSFDMKTFMAS